MGLQWAQAAKQVEMYRNIYRMLFKYIFPVGEFYLEMLLSNNFAFFPRTLRGWEMRGV